MRAIQPFAEILDTKIGVDVLKKIELVGRTCYKSTDKITDESAPKFVAGLIKRGHEAMVEHASFCFEIDYGVYCITKDMIQMLSTEFNFKSFMRFTSEERILISGNVRAWRDLFKHMNCFTLIPDCYKDFIQENPVLFPEWQDATFVRCNAGAIRPIHVQNLRDDDGQFHD